MTNQIVIFWFRQDLRLSDNPGLQEAAQAGTVLPIFILDTVNAKEFDLGGASQWWLHYSLKSLDESLNNKLILLKGDPQKIILDLVKKHNVTSVFWNRCYEPWQIARDKIIKKSLEEKNITAKSLNGSLLWEPWEPLKNDGTPYKVFTPFFRRGCLGFGPPRQPINKPRHLDLITKKPNSLSLKDLNLLPKIRWDKQLEPHWNIGEDGAKKRLKNFLNSGLDNYKVGRDFPAENHNSHLSPHLHWGEISPNQVWYASAKHGSGKDLEHFHSELAWREFSYSLLYHFPDLPRKNLQTKFDEFPWSSNKNHLEKWQKGQTGYPIVDAGMRELWQTGYMHNRVRMIVGSFLVKNLLIHWHHGEDWFWDCLVDADLANNSASWQWIAGCGADAAPYFRIFNPVTQGKKFDAHGHYTKKYIPELKDLPNKYLFAPWEAPKEILEKANVELGKDYPKPIVDLKESRERALDAFSTIKKS